MKTKLPMLVVRLLGAPEVLCTGMLIDFQQQKARALVFYLAATGRAHTRDHLATLFWGESEASSARHSLRSSLYNIRQALQLFGADDVLAIDGGVVGFRASTFTCDVLRFRAFVDEGSEGALTQAVALYDGPLLQGFTLADAPDFDGWERSTAARLRTLCQGALRKLADWAQERKAPDEVARYLQQLVQLDTLDEPAQRQLINFYLKSGSLAKALQQFERLEYELREELGVSPQAETIALIRDALRQQQAISLPSQRPESIEKMPIVGRDNTLEHFRALARDVSSGHGVTVLVQGGDGIGKTRVVSEFTEELAQAGSWRVLRGTCSPFDDMLDFGPFSEAFEPWQTENSAATGYSDLIAEPGEQLGAVPGGLFLRVLKAIRLFAQGGPLVLILEDLQWANSATLRLIGFLAARVRDLPVLLVGTVVRAEAIPALQRLLILGRRHGEVRLVTLEPLPKEAIEEMLRVSHVVSPSLQSLADWLYDRSGGNPYILGELVAQLRSEDILVKKADDWHLDSGRWLRWRATAALPETTHDLVAGRLTGLSAKARHLLDMLAVAGEALPFDLLCALPDGPQEHTLDVIEELKARQLLEEGADDSFDLPHHLVREALLSAMGRLRRRAFHRQLAATIEACPVFLHRIPRGHVARHAVAGGDVDRARRFGMQVVEGLQRDHVGSAGGEFLRDLYELLAPTAVAEERLLLARSLGRAYRETGKLDEARTWFGEALERAKSAGDIVAQVDACFEQAELALVANDCQAAVEAAEAGLFARAALRSPARAFAGRGHWLIGAALAMNGTDLVQASRHLRRALEDYRRHADVAGECLALFELGNVAAQHGHLERALKLYSEAARAAELSGDHYFLALAKNNFAYHSLLLGRVDAARQAVADGRRVAERAAIPAALLHLCSTEGEIALYAGEYAAADESFQSGLALAEEFGSLERQAGYRAGLAHVARGLGDFDRATTLYQESLALLDGRGYWHLQARVRLWLADNLLACGCGENARPILDATLAVARTHRREHLVRQGERLYARLLSVEGRWSEARELFRKLVDRERYRYPLEAARTCAAWGESVLQYGPQAEHTDAEAQLIAARTLLVNCSAFAEVAAIDHLLPALGRAAKRPSASASLAR